MVFGKGVFKGRNIKELFEDNKKCEIKIEGIEDKMIRDVLCGLLTVNSDERKNGKEILEFEFFKEKDKTKIEESEKTDHSNSKANSEILYFDEFDKID